MTVDTVTPRSRRNLLLGALGGVAAAAAATMSGAQRVLAAGSDGEPVVIGANYPDVGSRTTLRNSDPTTDGAQVGFRFQVGGSRRTDISADGIVVVHPGEDGLDGGYATTIARGLIDVSGGKHATGHVRISTLYGQAIVARDYELGVKGQGATGVLGDGEGAGVGVRGQSALGRGGRFKGKKAQVRLDPSAATNHPSSGARGDLFVDKSVRLWFCKGGTDWVRLA